MNEEHINSNANGDKPQLNTPQIINQYPIIGIDLGVSYWTASIVQNGQIYVIPIYGKDHLPAFIACINNDFKFGDEAKQMFLDNREVTIFDLVYILGLRFNSGHVLEQHMNDYSYALCNSGDKPKISLPNNKKTEISIEELIDVIINNIIYSTEIYLNSTIHNIVVPVPVYFKETQKSALLRSTSHVGIIDLIFEPIAAAYAYKISEKYKQNEIYNFLVYNLQEDNLDLSVIEYSNNTFKIKSNIYERHLKNNYTFRFLDELCTQTYETYFLSNPRFHPLNSGTLRFYCKTIFQDILDVNCFKIELDTIQEEKITRNISRQELDDLLYILVQESLLKIDVVLHKANLNKSVINEVLLVGKLTKHSIVRQVLNNYFSRDCLNSSLNPEDVLSIGAAIRADILQQTWYNTDYSEQKKSFCDFTMMPTKSAETIHNTLKKRLSLRKRKDKLFLHEKMLSMCTLFTSVVSKSNLKMCVKEKLLFVPAYLRSQLKRRSRKLRTSLWDKKASENLLKRPRKYNYRDLRYLLQNSERIIHKPMRYSDSETEEILLPESSSPFTYMDAVNCVKDNVDMYHVIVCFVVFLLHWASENICINIAIALISIAITLVMNNRHRQINQI